MLTILVSALGFPVSLTLAIIAGPFLFWSYVLGLIISLGLVFSRQEARDPRYAAFWRRMERKRREVKH